MANLSIPTVAPLADKPGFDQAMVLCASALLNDKEINQALEEILRVSGGFYQGSRCYFLDYQEKSRCFSGICQCFPQGQDQQLDLPLLTKDDVTPWNATIEQGKEVFWTQLPQGNSPYLTYLQDNQVSSLILAPVKREDNLLALLVLENPATSQPDLRLIRSVMVFVEVCIQKQDMISQLAQINQNQGSPGSPDPSPLQEIPAPLQEEVPEPFQDTEEEGQAFQDDRTNLQQDLLKAIESKEFQIYFQPKIQLSNQAVVGAEALVRRKISREDALVYPGIFVKLYEEQAIIRHLDLYVVESVCKTLANWQKQGIELPVSVNFSRVTLTEYGIVEAVQEICSRYQVPHHLLIIEFTERIAMMNETAYYNLAEQFASRGFCLSLDDFGAAYSNLITLAQIDVDEIKIDKSLIKDMVGDSKNQIVLKSILDLCQVIGDTVPLAEGIETKEQARMLEDFGCLYGQGNFFSPPVTEGEFFAQFLQADPA